MAIEIVDTHAHLGYPEFAAELPDIIQRAADAGVTRIITIGVDLLRSEQAIALAEKFSSVFAVVGVHPTEGVKSSENLTEPLRKLAAHPKVVGIGETGFDFHHLPSEKLPAASASDPSARPPEAGKLRVSDEQYKARQREVFRQHLSVAAERNLAVIIHQRDAFAETLNELKDFSKTNPNARLRGVFHCFGNSVAEAQAVIDFGFLVSFTGNITFKNAENVRAVARAMPLEKVMVETDCPYLAPVPFRGKRCEPAYTRQIAEKLAEVRNQPLEEVARRTTATAMQLFAIQ